MPREPGRASKANVTRRDFARGAVLVAATAALPRTAPSAKHTLAEGSSTQAAQLSPAGEAQFQTILSKYGTRLSDDQKADVRRLVAQAQKTSETLRSFPLDNSNEPAMVFHVYRKT